MPLGIAITALLLFIVWMIYEEPVLSVGIVLIAGMTFALRWLLADSKHYWGVIDLTIKTIAVSWLIVGLGYPIFIAIASATDDEGAQIFAAMPALVTIALAWAIYLRAIGRRIWHPSQRSSTRPSQEAA